MRHKEECEICGKSYNNIVNLMQHKLDEHGHDGYDCRMCNAKFDSMESMRTHIMRKHPFRRRE